LTDSAETGNPTNTRQDMIDQLRTELDEAGWRNIRLVERMLSSWSLTFPQVMVLSFLDRLGPDLDMSRIAEFTGLPASTITSIMDRLVSRELAERHQGETDRRRVTGSITEEGRNILGELESLRDASLSRMLEPFSDEELAILLKMINQWTSMIESI